MAMATQGQPVILYKDEAVMVIDKPAGMVVNRAESVIGKTIQDWVEQNFQFPMMERSGIAHRLDKETSGCLVIAKKPEVLVELMRQFKEREVKKTYVALVHGRMEPEEGAWRLPISRSRLDRTEFRVDPFGKVAETAYRVKQVYEGYTLVELFPKTGRTHQLRVHLKHLKHPIVADEKYLTTKQAKSDQGWCPRMFLHATAITFKQPETGQIITVVANLPKELDAVIQVL